MSGSFKAASVTESCSSDADEMRVIQIIDSLAPGGAETSLLELTPHMVGLSVDLEVVVLHDRPGLADQVRHAGATVTVLGGGSRPSKVANAVRLLQSRRPDLVHTTLFESDVIGRLGARVAGVPVVSSLVSTPYGPAHLAEPGHKPARLRAAQLVDMTTARLTARFRAVSVAVKDAYVERLHIRSDLVDVIPEGRDPERLGTRSAERRTAARDGLGVGPDEPVVLAVGRQDPAKGIEVLIRAAAELRHTVPGVRTFVAGGPGRSSAEIGSLIRDLQLEESVTLLGHRTDVPELLCAADVFALPSLREGIPGVLQEAMALSVPIVASDIGPVREALGGSDQAELAVPGDPLDLSRAVAAVIANPHKGFERAQLARARFLDEFDIRSVAPRILDFYRRALGGTGP